MKTFTTEQTICLMGNYRTIVAIHQADGLSKLDRAEIQEWQEALGDVLDLFEASSVEFPEAAQTHLNQLGAVLIRLSFLLHCNRHETPNEFNDLIVNYKVKQTTLLLKVTDLI